MDEIINGVNQSPNITLDTTDTTAIQAAAQAALVADNLDHLALTTDGVNNYPNLVVAGTILAKIISKAAAGATPSGYNCTTDSLEAIADAIAALPATTTAGARRVKPATIDLAQAAASYDLYTCSTQPVVIEGLTIQMPAAVDLSDDATITSISIQTDDTTAQTFIPAATAVKASMTAGAQFSWTGFTRLAVGKKIQLTIAGGAADAASVCLVEVLYHATVAGGTL